MDFSETAGAIVRWIASWDWYAIFYSLLGSAALVIVLRWMKFFPSLRGRIGSLRARRRYVTQLREECEHLIVVGRRTGFSTRSSFVPLDIVKSDLMHDKEQANPRSEIPQTSCVLVGGPGAGKSTLVKKLILDWLHQHRILPLFLRLRDYPGFDSIDAALAHRLESSGFVRANTTLQGLLQSPQCTCILDGLDEVRPEARDKVIADINTFYHRYFVSHGRLIVTCRKEAYRDTPLDIPVIVEVCPLSDDQIRQFSTKWPLGYPVGKSSQTFWRDLSATPKIHELARSPLLLVGGLMQYTEANQGIPDERYKYLQRVASWLISDWSTAQGHPPDPLRPLYDRILPRLAYELHRRRRTDIESPEAEQMVSRWLPEFGYGEASAAEVITALRTKTGILVFEAHHHLVFSQLSLQEFFASLQVNELVKPDDLSVLKPFQWWRETILLAVAQQRDPTPFLEALFREDAFLAAAAIAECPTPSTDMQKKAALACVGGVDKIDESVNSALVPLLRKVRGEVEQTLCTQLEERLSQKKKKARLIGLALATAGTEAATRTLARHPEVWEDCLASAGFLSESFEALLFQWIKEGSEDQSEKAAEILSGRSREQALFRLLWILEELPAERASRLASLILSKVTRRIPGTSRFTPVPFFLILGCVPHIEDGEKVARTLMERHIAVKEMRHPHKRGLLGDLRLPGLLMCAIFLRARRGGKLRESELNRMLRRATSWAVYRITIGAWLLCLAALATLGLSPILQIYANYFISAVLILLCSSRASPIPWRNETGEISVSGRISLGRNIALVGVIVCSTLLTVQGFSPWRLLPLQAMILCVAGVVLSVGKRRYYFDYSIPYHREGNDVRHYYRTLLGPARYGFDLGDDVFPSTDIIGPRYTAYFMVLSSGLLIASFFSEGSPPSHVAHLILLGSVLLGVVLAAAAAVLWKCYHQSVRAMDRANRFQKAVLRSLATAT